MLKLLYSVGISQQKRVGLQFLTKILVRHISTTSHSLHDSRNSTNAKTHGTHSITKRTKSSLSSRKKELFFDRVYPGPRLRKLANTKYLILFKKAFVQTPLYVPPPQLPDLKMKSSIQILSTPTADTPGTSIILHFDQKRYIIGNVAEGTQRATIQRKVGLVKVGEIFLTGTLGWHTAGGLLGMILTVADSAGTSRKSAAEQSKRKGKVAKLAKEDDFWLRIHGGKNLTHLLATARRFIFRTGMPLRTNELLSKDETQRKSWDPTWQDECINVWDMVIEPESSSARKRSHDEFSGAFLDPTTPISNTSQSKVETTEEQEDRDAQIRQGVVTSMFDSDWRMDALFTKKLSDVAVPAAIFVRNEAGKIEKYTGPMPGRGVEVPDIDVLVRNPWPGALISRLPSTTPSVSSVCYIMKGYPQRGKFDPQAAIKLGVKKGAAFSALTSGKDVTTEAGNVVTPEMVMGPSTEGHGFAVLELPDVSYVGPLLSRAEWSSAELMAGIKAAIWILGPGVLEDTRLQDFMQKHSELEHIVSSKDCCPNYIALESAASAAIRQNLIDPERFPIPKFSNVVDKPIEGPKPYISALPGTIYDLVPRFQQRKDTTVPHLDTATVTKEAQENTEVLELAKLAHEEVTSPEYLAKLDERQKDIPSKDAEVVTLGTGSSLPSKYRNVSATLLRVPGFGSYLFDCGENTLGQLKRVFGDETPEVLRDLKAIWISHLHADHHLGTAAVVKAWSIETARDDRTKNNRLHVIAQEDMINWLREYSEIEDIGYKRVMNIMVSRSQEQSFKFSQEFEPEIREELGLASVQACSVKHCHGAAAVVFNFPNHFKVAYSGDCRPSFDFAKMGRNATLLIHEATFDDELQSDAYAKRHSTTAEALDIGRRMFARRILLTHFSQRYQKIPVMDDNGQDQVAIVAFDYMRVKIGDFAKVDAFKPALMKLYEEEVVSMEESKRH